ncbi:MAG: hypothetical protein ACKVPX_14110 [Myxococcaceae bacterium]
MALFTAGHSALAPSRTMFLTEASKSTPPVEFGPDPLPPVLATDIRISNPCFEIDMCGFSNGAVMKFPQNAPFSLA